MLAAAIFILRLCLDRGLLELFFCSCGSGPCEEDLPKKMTFVGSNIGSSSGAGSSGGPLAHTWISLTLEEQLTNFERTICKERMLKKSSRASFFEFVARVVKELRIDPNVDIGSFFPHVSHVGYHFLLLQGTTPLHWAILMDDRAMVQYILTSENVDINASARVWEETALYYAIIGGNCNIVEDLFKYNVDVGICDFWDHSALYYMVRQKDSMFGILKTILAKNVNMCDKIANTTLHHVALEGATDVVVYLLNKMADVNLYNQFGYTPLHCAAEKGAMNIVSLLVEQNAEVNALSMDGSSPLLLSISNGRVATSNGLIAVGADVHVKDKVNNNTLHLAIKAYDREQNMMDIVKLLQEHDVHANAKNSQGYFPFFVVVVEGHIEVVKELLRSKEKIMLMEECNGQTTIQIAFDYGHDHIKRALLECNDVSRYVETLFRDRQVYVDAANAILVGAALIASVTFASWLQPPLGYTTSYLDLVPSSPDINYVDVQHNVSLRVFWIFNALSFYFAIGTVVFGARSVLPRRQMFIKTIVVKLHQNLLVTSILLACSVLFVLIAFGIAGCIVLTPTLKFQWYMIVPTIFGGLVCLISLGFLFKSMLEDNLEKKRETFHLY